MVSGITISLSATPLLTASLSANLCELPSRRVFWFPSRFMALQMLLPLNYMLRRNNFLNSLENQKARKIKVYYRNGLESPCFRTSGSSVINAG